MVGDGMGAAWQVSIRHGRTILNQMGKTHSKPLAARHGNGMLCVWIGLNLDRNVDTPLPLNAV